MACGKAADAGDRVIGRQPSQWRCIRRVEMDTDDQAIPDEAWTCCDKSVGHRRRRLPDGEQEGPSGASVEVCGGGVDDARRQSRTNRGVSDSEEIASTGRARVVQWRFLGSDQAERPVTTSNFFRSRLTT